MAGVVLELSVGCNDGEPFRKSLSDYEIEEVTPFRIGYGSNVAARGAEIQLRTQEGFPNRGCCERRVCALRLSRRRENPNSQHECCNYPFRNRIVRQLAPLCGIAALRRLGVR